MPTTANTPKAQNLFSGYGTAVRTPLNGYALHLTLQTAEAVERFVVGANQMDRFFEKGIASGVSRENPDLGSYPVNLIRKDDQVEIDVYGNEKHIFAYEELLQVLRGRKNLLITSSDHAIRFTPQNEITLKREITGIFAALPLYSDLFEEVTA